MSHLLFQVGKKLCIPCLIGCKYRIHMKKGYWQVYNNKILCTFIHTPEIYLQFHRNRFFFFDGEIFWRKEVGTWNSIVHDGAMAFFLMVFVHVYTCSSYRQSRYLFSKGYYNNKGFPLPSSYENHKYSCRKKESVNTVSLSFIKLARVSFLLFQETVVCPQWKSAPRKRNKKF